MRYFNFKNSFDAAVNFFTSFGYFDNDRENFQVIENVSGSLKTGGYFVFDFLNKNYLEKNLRPYSNNNYENVTVVQKRKIENNIVRKEIFIKSKNNTLKFTEVLKLYSVSEFKIIFDSYNLRIQNLFGDYFGNKFNKNNSKRLIIIAKKI